MPEHQDLLLPLSTASPQRPDYSPVCIFSFFQLLLHHPDAAYPCIGNSFPVDIMARFFKSLKLISLAAAAFFAASCQSLPEGASAPSLKIESLALDGSGDNPHFIITYILEHKSATSLPIKSVKADVFVNNVQTATVSQNMKGDILPANEKHKFTLEVPVNLSGSASIDSMTNNPLLVLQGSCAVTVRFTDEEELSAFNPSSSYTGLVKVIK